jgi:hypothetical protein
MKTKVFNKKLALNKTTIINLSVAEQQEIKGGVYPTSPTYCQGKTCLVCNLSLYPVTTC